MSRPARKQAAPRAGNDTPSKVKTTITFDPDAYKLLQLASIEAGSDMSDIVNALIREKYSGWHIRKSRASVGGVDPHTTPTPADIDSAELGVLPGQPSTVRIAGVTNRIGAIARKSTLPVDDALDSLAGDHDRPE